MIRRPTVDTHVIDYVPSRFLFQEVHAVFTRNELRRFITGDNGKYPAEAGIVRIPIRPHTETHAVHDRPYGLYLGDCACLSLGIRLNVPVLTAAQIWARSICLSPCMSCVDLEHYETVP